MWNKNPTSKYLRSWNLHLKPNLAITFWAAILMISFEDLMWIFYVWVPNTTIEGAMKKEKNTLLLLLDVWPKIYGFSIPEHFFRILYHARSPKDKHYGHMSTTKSFYNHFLSHQSTVNSVWIKFPWIWFDWLKTRVAWHGRRLKKKVYLQNLFAFLM
jgi:hypothetical protein